MTGFADGSRARDLALLERPAPACRGRRRRRGRGGRRGARRVPGHQAPRGRLQPRRPFHEQKPQAPKTVDWPLYGHDTAANPLPAGQGPRPAVPLLAVELPGRQAARVPADRGQGQDLLHGQGRDVLRAQHRQGQGPVEAQDRVAERVVARLCRRPAVRGQPRAAAGAGARAAQARKQGALAPPAAGPQRVLAPGPRRAR